MRRRSKILISLALLGFVTVAVAVTAARIPFSSDTLRRRVVEELSTKLDAEVELDDLSLRLLPTVKIQGTGLRIRHRARRDVPPLINIDTFIVNSALGSIWRSRVDAVRLAGLDITIPPDDDDERDAAPSDRQNTSPASDVRDTTPAPDRQGTAASPADRQETITPSSLAKQVIITSLEAPEARLIILRRDPNKPARTWYMHSLRLRNVGIESAMPFESVLTNGVPPGEIVTAGSFGPWNADDPGRTPLDGRFTFEHADLSVFNGISGMLSAKGTFNGQLERIIIDGQTDTPDFKINISGHTVPLTTTYHAVVDGTNGNTTLDPVNATFVNTSLVARGGVYDVPDVDGRVVRLDVQMESGKLEDLMRLAVNTPRPPMTGTLHLMTALTIPPGKQDIVEKLQLNGRFRIERGRFTDRDVQAKINDLSRRARGKLSEETAPAHVTSDFEGQFRLAKANLAIPKVTFDVPGAMVQLAGGYAMRRETVDFNGDLFMDAKISQTVTGFKSLLLKMADPFFRRDGRTVVPLKIDGKRNDPHFGLDVRRVFKRGDTPAPKNNTSTPKNNTSTPKNSAPALKKRTPQPASGPNAPLTLR